MITYVNLLYVKSYVIQRINLSKSEFYDVLVYSLLSFDLFPLPQSSIQTVNNNVMFQRIIWKIEFDWAIIVLSIKFWSQNKPEKIIC